MELCLVETQPGRFGRGRGRSFLPVRHHLLVQFLKLFDAFVECFLGIAVLRIGAPSPPGTKRILVLPPRLSGSRRRTVTEAELGPKRPRRPVVGFPGARLARRNVGIWRNVFWVDHQILHRLTPARHSRVDHVLVCTTKVVLLVFEILLPLCLSSQNGLLKVVIVQRQHVAWCHERARCSRMARRSTPLDPLVQTCYVLDPVVNVFTLHLGGFARLEPAAKHRILGRVRETVWIHAHALHLPIGKMRKCRLGVTRVKTLVWHKVIEEERRQVIPVLRPFHARDPVGHLQLAKPMEFNVILLDGNLQLPFDVARPLTGLHVFTSAVWHLIQKFPRGRWPRHGRGVGLGECHVHRHGSNSLLLRCAPPFWRIHHLLLLLLPPVRRARTVVSVASAQIVVNTTREHHVGNGVDASRVGQWIVGIESSLPGMASDVDATRKVDTAWFVDLVVAGVQRLVRFFARPRHRATVLGHVPMDGVQERRRRQHSSLLRIIVHDLPLLLPLLRTGLELLLVLGTFRIPRWLRHIRQSSGGVFLFFEKGFVRFVPLVLQPLCLYHLIRQLKLLLEEPPHVVMSVPHVAFE